MKDYLKLVEMEKDSVTYYLWSGFDGKVIRVYEDAVGILEADYITEEAFEERRKLCER